MAQSGHRQVPDRIRQSHMPVGSLHRRHLCAVRHNPPPQNHLVLSRSRLHPFASSVKCNRMIPHFLPLNQCFSHQRAIQKEYRKKIQVFS